MRCLWCNDSFSSWHDTIIISHVLKWQKGGLGACTGIIPRKRYKQYSDFHNQKAEWKEGNNEVDDCFNQSTLLQCLPSIEPNKRDRLVCVLKPGHLLMLNQKRERQWIFKSLILLYWKWLLWTFSIARTYSKGLLSQPLSRDCGCCKGCWFRVLHYK